MLIVNANIISSILTDLVNHMLPDISELVLREWFAEELNCTKL